MKLVRTDGPYEIYGDDSGHPFHLAAERLDTSLSLGTGALHARGRRRGLRTDDAQIQQAIERYELLWKRGVRPAHILVQGMPEGGRLVHTNTVVDGAMWVAAAMRCGAERVPVYVVTYKGQTFINPEAIWLYFNCRHGLHPSQREINAAVVTLARYARSTGMTSEEFIRDYSAATGLPEQTIKVPALQAGIWARRRTSEEIAEDRRMLAAGVPKSEIAARRGVSRRAVTKTQQAQRKGADGQASAGPAPEPAQEVAASLRAAQTREQILRAGSGLRTVLASYIDALDKLMSRPSADVASPVELLPPEQCIEVWKVIEPTWVELTELGIRLGVFEVPEIAYQHRALMQRVVNQMKQAFMAPGGPAAAAGNHATTAFANGRVQ